MELVFGLLIIGFFLSLGYIVGGLNERRHFQSLDEREAEVANVLTTQLKSFPLAAQQPQPPTILVAEAVISSDYLKTFLAGWRRFFGGEIRSFRGIMERARREALLQLKEQAVSQGFNALCNVRIETADLAGKGQQQKNKIVMASILASGTAYNAHIEGHGIA